MDVTRGGFLRLGAAGVTTAAGGMLVGGAALAAPPPATPQGDDVGFLTFGVVAERTALAFYKKTLTTPKLFDVADRRRLSHARTAKREHVTRINAALGADAVGSADYQVDFPKSAFASRDGALALGESLEGLLVGVYVNAAGDALDKLITVPGSPGGG